MGVKGWSVMKFQLCIFAPESSTQVYLFSFSFSFLQPMLGFFFGNCFFLAPHTHLGLTYLTIFRLPAYAPWPPHSLTYLPTDLPTQLPTFLSIYLLMYLHMNFPPGQ
jgi:hypothetical protein